MNSLEEIWQTEKTRRKRLRKWMLIIVLVFFLSSVLLWAMVTQPLLSPVERNPEIPSVSPANLQHHVQTLSEVFIPRDAPHPENLDRVANYIRQEFENAKADVSEQAYEVNGTTYKNIIAAFGPRNKERIIVGAHYDAAGEYPGADDNASGIAGLIELAHLLQDVPLPMSVELAAYTLEEPPFFRTAYMGSAIHADSVKQQQASVRLMISLEMIGYFSDAPNSQNYPLSLLGLFYPSKGNFIAVVGSFGSGSTVRKVKRAMRSASSLPIYSINAPAFLPGIDFSDHLNYWRVGYDAVMVTDTAFYRNSAYHTANDKADRLDYQRMAMTVQGVYATVLAFRR